MPEISRFLGIVISIYYQDHNPPHFHILYEKYEASIEIENLKILRGSLPPRIYGFVAEWALIHKSELLQNWELARNLEAPRRIKPLIS